MGFTIEKLQRPASGAMYVAPERICVTADGQICDEADPAAVRLLVGKGCEIPAAEAAKYGLIADVADDGAGDEAPAFPRAVSDRRGYYELSNGDVVKGKARAEEAQAELGDDAANEDDDASGDDAPGE